MRTLKNLCCALIALFTTLSAAAQSSTKKEPKFPSPAFGKVTQWETALSQAKQENKWVMIDCYTDWCGWCKHMVRTTYSNPGIANYINANFYPVQFDAETTDTIEYNGKVYNPLSAAPRQAP